MSNKLRFGFIFCSLLIYVSACGTADKIVKKRNIADLLANNTNVKPPVYSAPVLKDTIHITYNDTAHVIFIRRPEKTLVKDGTLPPYDTLLKQHLNLAQHYLRAIDTSRHRKHQLDSSQSYNRVLNLKLDRIIRNQKDNQDEANKAKIDKAFSNGEVWLGFGILVLFSAINLYATTRRNRHKKIEYDVK